ncbi:HEPN domain-containing protein, partial [Candidatus Woesearchaeota archaeon]|nr:HEPN domain-containing protein [Candidatus Woesearchaeota archaeon]
HKQEKSTLSSQAPTSSGVLFAKLMKQGIIYESGARFKSKLFLKKAKASIHIAEQAAPVEPFYWDSWAITMAYYAMLYAAKAAILEKGYEVKTHDAAEVAIEYLLVPDVLEKDDLELLNQAHKIFEEEYVTYFHNAKKEAHYARYHARPSYTERRKKEILNNAQAFIEKILYIL